MGRLFCLAILINSLLLIEGVRTRKKLQDKPSNEFVSMGSMDEMVQSLSLLSNTRISHLNFTLEKLAEKMLTMRSTPQPLVQHIERIQIQPPTGQSTMIDREVYSKAVEALRKVAPNVQTVTLIGSYMFKPGNENRPDLIKDEIVFVRNYIKNVINAFESRNITVENVRFVVGIIVPEKTQTQVDFGRLIRSTFGYQPNPEEVDSKTVGMIIQMNETTCYLGIGMNPSKQEDGWMTPTSIIAIGRSRFQEQVILTNFKPEWYTRVLDLINTEPSSKHAKHRVNDLSRHKLFSNSVSADDPKVRAVGRTNDLPRRLFASQSEMDFMQFQQPPQLELEDFFDRHVDSIQVENQVEKLGLKVTVQNRTGISMERMYKNAVENLKKLVPNLKEVSIYGGYLYHPLKPGKDSVKQEIEYLAANVRAWISAFNDANVKVSGMRFVATFDVSNKIRETSQYVDALKHSFNYSPTKTEIEQNAVRMRVEFNSVPCQIGIHFRDVERDQASCPPPMSDRSTGGRSPQFNYFCTEKRPMLQWYRSVWTNQQFTF